MKPPGPPPWALALAIAVLAFAPYAQLRDHQFLQFDDGAYVAGNPVVLRGLSAEGVRWAFGGFRVANWHPLTWISHMLDVELLGREAGPMLLVNAGLHACNSALLFLVLLAFTGAPWASALVPALFGVHPLHVESVAWLSERKDVLSTLFGLLGLLAYSRYVRRPRPASYVLVAIAFAASLLAKPMLVTLPFVMLLLDAWPLGRLPGCRWTRPEIPIRSWKILFLEKVPLLLLSAASSIVTWLAQAGSQAIAGAALGLEARVANATVAYAAYVWKTLWPTSLAAFYPMPAGGYGAASVALAAAFGVAISILAVATARRAPWIAVGWSWYLGTLVPVVGIVQVGSQAMADRYTYFPLIGIFIAVAWSLRAGLDGRSERARRAAGAIAVVTLLGLTAVTWRQVGYWRDHETLFLHAVEVTGPNAAAHASLAGHYGRRGLSADALRHAAEAVRIDPSNALGQKNLASALRDARRLPEAVAAARAATGLSPADAEAWRILGVLLRDAGDMEGSRSALDRSALLEPDDPATWMELASTALARQDLDSALRAMDEATRLDPANPRAWFNRGYVLGAAGRLGDAAASYARALGLRPDYTAAARNLAATCEAAGPQASGIPACRPGGASGFRPP
jgi:hypothetical protein